MNAEDSRSPRRGRTTPSVDLRPATLADLALLRHWDSQPHVRAGVPVEEWDWETELAETVDWRQSYIAQANRTPVGFVQVMDPAGDDTRYWGEVTENVRAVDIWIGEVAYLNRGYGTAIMQRVLRDCFADSSVAAVLLDPLADNIRAHRFYERLRFRFVECRQLGRHRCCVYRLDRADFVGG